MKRVWILFFEIGARQGVSSVTAVQERSKLTDALLIFLLPVSTPSVQFPIFMFVGYAKCRPEICCFFLFFFVFRSLASVRSAWGEEQNVYHSPLFWSVSFFRSVSFFCPSSSSFFQTNSFSFLLSVLLYFASTEASHREKEKDIGRTMESKNPGPSVASRHATRSILNMSSPNVPVGFRVLRMKQIHQKEDKSISRLSYSRVHSLYIHVVSIFHPIFHRQF